MKWFRNIVKIVIGTGSLAAFAGGWILFGHSGKPVTTMNTNLLNAGSSSSSGSATDSTTSIDPLPTLEPLPSLNGSAINNASPSTLQTLPQQPSSNFTVRPRLRGRGS